MKKIASTSLDQPKPKCLRAISVRIPSELYDVLKAAAKRDGRSVTNFLTHRLMHDFCPKPLRLSDSA